MSGMLRLSWLRSSCMSSWKELNHLLVRNLEVWSNRDELIDRFCQMKCCSHDVSCDNSHQKYYAALSFRYSKALIPHLECDAVDAITTKTLRLCTDRCERLAPLNSLQSVSNRKYPWKRPPRCSRHYDGEQILTFSKC